MYGHTTYIIDNFIDTLAKHVNPKIDTGLGTNPVYLRDDVYIINHTHDGTPISKNIIIMQSDNKIFFKENHAHFKTDIYYYTDNRSTPVDVFYTTITLRLVGYKEKHKEYVNIDRSNSYLIISPSIRDRLYNIGYETKYINMDTFTNIEYSYVMNNLIKEHICKTKNIIEKFISIIYKIKNDKEYQDTEDLHPIQTPSSQKLGDLILKIL